MDRGYIKVKEWFIDKQQSTATRYNCFIDKFDRNELGMAIVENGYIKVMVEEVIGESEKAVHVVLRTGDIVGSCKGWECWIPKSCIA